MGADAKFRILIVDDISETRENVRKLLQFENDFEVVGAARTGREAIDAARETRPDVILMDINMPDMDGITATETIHRNDPVTQIIILSVQGDPNYMRRAMLAGARDFLTKPPALDDLVAAIRRAGKIAHEERQKAASQPPAQAGTPTLSAQASTALGKIILLYSPKGGAGATTMAVNLATTLHNDENPVVLVDGSLQFGDVSVFINEQVKNHVADLTPRADELDAEIVEEVLAKHSLTGMRLLACPPRPELAESVNPDQFAKVLQFLRVMYSYVVVDTCSTLTEPILAAMDVADVIILITTQDIPAIKSARLYLDLADRLKISRKRILLVMNRFDKRIGILPEKVAESFHHGMAAVIPFDERTVVPSINRGTPFMLGDRSRPAARGILDLAQVVRQTLVEFSQADSGREKVAQKRPGR